MPARFLNLRRGPASRAILTLKQLSSPENRIIKEAASLSEKKYRDKLGLFLLEGPNLVREAMQQGGRVRFIFTRAGAAGSETAALAGEAEAAGLAVYELTESLFAKVALTQTPQDIAAVAEKRQTEAGGFFEKVKDGCILVLDRLQDPGNVGTLVRSAEAMGFKGILAIKGTADLWQPKAVRAAAGSILRLPVLICDDAEQALELLGRAGKTVYTADMDGQLPCWDAQLAKDAAVVIGNEGSGASEKLKAAARLLAIPMDGPTESLNAAAAGSIIMYESMRQRKDGKHIK